MPKRDRYGNCVTTQSSQAFDAYLEGVDLFLAAQAGGIEKLTQATQLDPTFALAHADLARALQIVAKPHKAREHMALAQEHSKLLAGEGSDQEFAHIAIMGLLVGGKSLEAFEQIKQHVLTHPRDVLAVQPCCGVFGLIGFSGRANREQENLDFMAALHKHYADDWWFESQYAFALCETGDLVRAEVLNDKALAARPDNANGVHHRAHIHYETGEIGTGREKLNQWRSNYSRDGILHCHLAWHDALWALAAGDETQLWQIVAADILPEVTTAPPINVMTDLVAVLVRTRLKGVTPPQELWKIASDYAAQCFPKPGVSFADVHSAIAHALYLREASNETSDARATAELQLAGLQSASRGWAPDSVSAIADAFKAFADQDWESCRKALKTAMVSHERLGGSRAQRDLLELTQAYVETELGQEPQSARAKALA